MPNIIAWIVVLILITINIVVWIWAFHAKSDLNHCHNNESYSCPSYHCSNTVKECANNASGSTQSGAAYRTGEDGKTQCQQYVISTAVTNTTPAQRENWPN